MSVRSFLALHLCWQLTALLQFLQSSKPAAALAGMPFLIPPLHSLSPPFTPPSLFLTFFCLDQKYIVTKPDQAPWRDQILRHNYKHVVHALTLSSWFQTTNPEFWRPAIALISLTASIPKNSHHLCKADSNINQDKSRVLECRFIVTSDLETSLFGSCQLSQDSRLWFRWKRQTHFVVSAQPKGSSV